MKLRWLVVGIGDITTRRVLPAILSEPRSELSGIVTRDPRKAEPYQVPGWENLEDALTHCAADAVYVATPVALHAPQSIASLRAGKHVLCEKPMAMNYAEAVAMEQTARETGRTLGVAYYRRMYSKVNRAKERIESGAIGRPFLAEATSHGWSDFSAPERRWLSDPKLAGGGPLHDVACHRIDLMNYFFGAPVKVSGHRSTLVQKVAVEDNASLLIDYENGARAFIDVRWHSKIPRDEFRIRGTEGEIDLTPLNGDTLISPTGRESIPAPENLHFPCIENFVAAILDGAPLRSSAASSLPTDWVLEQAST